MKVIDFSNTTHTLVLIPRYYPTGAITLELTEEATQTLEVVANTYSTTDGNLSIVFDYDFTGKDKFAMTLKETNEIVYRGKLVVTDQEPQDYKQTNTLYTYYE
jgi:hypothetical protein